MRLRFVVLLPFLFAGCKTLAVSPEADREARRVAGLIAQGRLNEARIAFGYREDSAAIAGGLQQLHDSGATFLGDSMRLVGWNVTTLARGPQRLELRYEARAGSRVAFMTVSLTGRDSTYRVTDFEMQATPEGNTQDNAFTLRGKGLIHFIYLAAALLSLGACLAGAVIAARERMGVRWVLFSLLGFSKATLNWTTGAQALRWFSVSLLGAGMARTGTYGPWMLSFSFPLGAVLAFSKWNEKKKGRSATGGSGPSTSPSGQIGAAQNQ